MIETCDHVVALRFDNLIRLSKFQDFLGEEAYGNTSHAKTIAFLESAKEPPKVYSELGIFRMGDEYYTRFQFCPDCGEKIDWAGIEKGITEG